tara:strand:+ start:667 stop:1038 length:372 start_codon:yes stop_codon:yes gene_type:complete
MLAVADMKETIGFYVDVLKFELFWESPDYSVIKSGDAEIHLMLASDEKVMEYVRGHSSIYVEVEGITSQWSHVKNYKENYKIKDLFDRDYGMREFHISDPNECLVFVGEQIKHAEQIDCNNER